MREARTRLTRLVTVILAASQAGYPPSTTHVTSGGVVGSGVGKRAATVHWGITGRMATAWLLTLPAAAGLFFQAQRSAPVTSEDV